jgi:cysteine desulfurase/selenocysteine lyase
MTISVEEIKRDFPIFQKRMRNDAALVYLDSGATAQKPLVVVDAERDFYLKHNAAVHRGSHLLAEEASLAYENAREVVAQFIGASIEETIFTKSATESLNAVAYSFGNSRPGSRFFLQAGDEILVSEMEHHANLIPWQELCFRTGASLKWIPVTPQGRLDLSEIDSLINPRTRVVALTHQSNVLGTINPIKELAAKAHSVGAVFVLDACQSVPHAPIDVKDLDVDFMAFSGHKAVGPTGVGVLYGKYELLDLMEPFLYGGSMIESVTMEKATYSEPPRKFEAGVPNMAQAVGLGAALEYLSKIGMENIAEHERQLTAYGLKALGAISGVSIIGPTEVENRGSTISFSVEGIHPHDLGQVLDQYGIAIRTGHHCAWPLMKKYGLSGTARASFYFYNDTSDIDALVNGIVAAQKYFAVGESK